MTDLELKEGVVDLAMDGDLVWTVCPVDVEVQRIEDGPHHGAQLIGGDAIRVHPLTGRKEGQVLHTENSEALTLDTVGVMAALLFGGILDMLRTVRNGHILQERG